MSVGKGGYNTAGKTSAQLRAEGRRGRATQDAKKRQRKFDFEAPF